MKRLILGALLMASAMVQAQQNGEFTIAVLPDTQYYTEEKGERNNRLFESQTQWIVDNYKKENIVYVVHVGDIVNRGDEYPEQWVNAAKAMSILEKPLPGLPNGIPFGMAVGNHDQTPSQFAVTGGTKGYNKHFGVDHFKGRKYYGGHYGKDNDSHYDLFSAGGTDFLVIYIEYDAMDEATDALNDWAVSLCHKYPSRKVIVVSHGILFYNPVQGLNANAPWLKQGQRIYDRLKTCPNVFMMLCGHIGDNGEGYRQDGYAGHTIKSFLADYQSRPMGGGSLMRLMTFDSKNDLIKVRTIAPFFGTEETDSDSKFVKPWMHGTTSTRLYDFNNDSKAEFAFCKKGLWTINGKKGTVVFGMERDIPVPADYNADGSTVLAAYSPTTSTFMVQGKAPVQWGQPGDIPVPGDYNGDGLVELATWNPTDMKWYIQGQEPIRHGFKSCVLVPADYDGDGKIEPAVYRVQNHVFYISGVANVPLGKDGDIPVPADYNGDGRAEIAVYRPSTGEWLVYGQKPVVLGGDKDDIPVPADYEGKRRVQFAVYNTSTGVLKLDSGTTIQVGKGTVDEVVNLPYAIRKYIKEMRTSTK